jgi:general stress protein YciG
MGFQHISREARVAIARQGGAAPRKAGGKSGHKFTPEEARAAGQKGGRMAPSAVKSAAGRKGGLTKASNANAKKTEG